MSDLFSRRSLLRTLPLGGLLVGAAACDSARPREGLLGAMGRVNDRAQELLFNPTRLAPELAPGSETDDHDFPAYKIGDFYPALPANWALKVGGLCARPGLYSLEQLKRLPMTQVRVRHHCVEGWSAVASWEGVRVSELARLVGADGRASAVEFRSFENGYYSSWDRGSALHPQTLLAFGRNGLPIPARYGAPLRLYSAVKLGYKMVKWVSEVNFLPQPSGGYWEDLGYEWFAGV